MHRKMTPTNLGGRFFCKRLYSAVITGDLSMAMRGNLEKFVRSVNRKSGREILRIEFSDRSSVLADSASQMPQMLLFVPEEADLTIQELERLLERQKELIMIALGSSMLSIEYKKRYRIPDGKGGFRYYRIMNKECLGEFSVREIFPMSDEEFEQLLGKMRNTTLDVSDDEFGLPDPQEEYDMNRCAEVSGVLACRSARRLFSEHLGLPMSITDSDPAEFLRQMKRVNEIPDSAFEEVDWLIPFFYGDMLNTPQRVRACTLEAYMGAWMGEWIHALNANWKWQNANLDTDRQEMRPVLKNVQTEELLDPIRMARAFLRNGDETKILSAMDKIKAGHTVSSDAAALDEAAKKSEPSAQTEEPFFFLGEDEPESRPFSIRCATNPSSDAQSEISRMIDLLNTQLGFGALKSGTLDLPTQPFAIELATNGTYSFDQLQSACQTLQRAYDLIRVEFPEETIQSNAGQRIALADGHTWVKITVEDDNIVWRDEYCPYEGEFARMLEQICYDDYSNAHDLEQAMLEQPESIWQGDVNLYMAGATRIRALSLIDLMREFFDREIDISTDSLAAVAMFMNAVRNSLIPNGWQLRKDASPRVTRMFRALLKRENENGTMELTDVESLIFNELIRVISGWLGELLRTNFANFVWQGEAEKDENGNMQMITVLYETQKQTNFYPMAQQEKFFDYAPDALSIDLYYYALAEQLHLKPATKHEYRFKQIPRNNILPFLKK